MITLFRNTPVTRECNYYSYNSHGNDINLQKLKDNESRDPRIKVAECTDYINGYYSQLGLYTYVGLQALSKLLPNPISLHSRQTRSPDEYLIRDLNNYYQDTASDTNYNIDFMAIAPSNMERSCIRNKRNTIGISNEALDKQFKEFSDMHIFGTTVSSNKHNVLIFINIKNAFKALYQIMSLVLVFRLIGKESKNITNEHEYQLFEKLAGYFANKRFLEPGETPNYNNLHLIFLEYIDGLDEYTIDQTDEFRKLLTKIRERKFSSLKQRAEDANDNLKRALEQISNAQKEYDEANALYAAALLLKSDDCELQLKEAIDLLTRSPRVSEHGLDGTKLWFTMLQPLNVNDKTEWERISHRLIQVNKTRELLNKTLVDEEFELWTECTVSFDFDTSRVGKYGDNARTKSPNAIPHPHVGGFGCFGQHTSIIGQLIAEADFLGAVEQSIEAGSGLNWSDGPVTNRFAGGFNSSYKDIKCFKTKSGTWFSLNDYTEGRINETTDKQNTDIDDITNG